MKKLSKATIVLISIILGLVVIWTILKKISLLEVLNSFREATLFSVISFILVSIGIMIMITWRWKIIVDTKVKIPFYKLFTYKIMGYGISFLTPAAKIGGEPLRAMMLQKHKLTFREGFSTVSIDKIIDMTTSGVLFIFGVLIALITIKVPKTAAILLITFTVIIMGIIIWFYLRLISDQNVLLKIFKLFRLDKIKKLRKMEENLIKMDKLLVSFHKHHRKSFNKAIIISAIAWVLMFLEYQTALMIFGITNVSFGGLFLIISMMGLAYLVPIPLALGVLEAGQISVFTLLNLKPSAAVGLSTIIRGRDFLWSLVGIGVLIFNGFNVSKIYTNTINKLTTNKVGKKEKKD